MPTRVKCALVVTAAGAVRSHCATHGYQFSHPVTATESRCPIGRLEDIEARLDSIEDAVHEIVARASRSARAILKALAANPYSLISVSKCI